MPATLDADSRRMANELGPQEYIMEIRGLADDGFDPLFVIEVYGQVMEEPEKDRGSAEHQQALNA